jgi:hypothetical protein
MIKHNIINIFCIDMGGGGEISIRPKHSDHLLDILHGWREDSHKVLVQNDS